jgi:hypothetical protein
VTAPPETLAAHDDGTELTGLFEQRIDRLAKLGCTHVRGVAPEGLVAQSAVRRFGWERSEPAEALLPAVLHVVVRCLLFQCGAMELWITAAAGANAHVDKMADPGIGQQLTEPRCRVSAVTDRQ